MKYNRSGHCLQNLTEDNFIEFCKRWLHLAGIREFIEDLDELCKINQLEPYSKIVGTGSILGNRLFNDNSTKVVQPIMITHSNRYKRPYVIYDRIPESMNDLVKGVIK